MPSDATTARVRRETTGIRQLAAAAALFLLSASLAPAEAGSPKPAARWQVRLDTGSSVRVLAIVPDDPDDPSAYYTRLVLPNGGSVRVPSELIRRVEELEPPAAPALAAELPEAVRRWDALVDTVARRHDLDPELVRTLILVESAGDPHAVSKKGAVGLMQLLPTTAADYGLTEAAQLRDPEANLEAGCRHLARLHGKMDGDLELTLAAYNAGEGAVARFGGVPAYTETREYVRRILARLGSTTG